MFIYVFHQPQMVYLLSWSRTRQLPSWWHFAEEEWLLQKYFTEQTTCSFVLLIQNSWAKTFKRCTVQSWVSKFTSFVSCNCFLMLLTLAVFDAKSVLMYQVSHPWIFFLCLYGLVVAVPSYESAAWPVRVPLTELFILPLELVDQWVWAGMLW